MSDNHEHVHHHSHTQTRAVLNRLSKIEGHIASIKKMIADERDCSEVLIQLSAVSAAVNSTAKVILEDHFEHCITDAIKNGDEKAIQEFYEALKHLI